MNRLANDGFEIFDNFFNAEEVNSILQTIKQANTTHTNFRITAALFAIRQFIKTIPEVYPLIFVTKFNQLIADKAGLDYKLVKAIYFDKPPQSNWFVSYHQDLTISVKQRGEYPGFGPWTVKHDQFSVQPPVEILEDNLTIRIHLDDTTVDNGALKVIPGSHLNGIIRYDVKDQAGLEKEVACAVTAGGIMLMKPLLLHSSGRTTNNAQRRVIHLEFSRAELPAGMEWAEEARIAVK